MQVNEELQQDKGLVALIIELDRSDIEADLAAAAKRVSGALEIPGFRKGSAPYDIVARHLGGEDKIYHEALDRIIDRTAKAALAAKNYKTIGKPSVEVTKLVPGFGLAYKIMLSLMPEITLGDPAKIKEKKRTITPNEDDAAKVLTNLREMRVTEAAVDRAIIKGDKAVLDFTVKKDGVVIDGGTAKDYELIIGEGRFIPGFEEEVVGLKVGEQKTFELEFPKEYHEKSLAGKKASFAVTIKQVFERVLPELDDEFAKNLGDYKTAAELRDKVRENLTYEKAKEENERFELAVMRELVELSKIGEISEQVIKEEADNMVHELEHDVERQGIPFAKYLESIKKTHDELVKDFVPKARERVNLMLVARAYGEAKDVKVEDNEIESEIEISKKAYQNSPELRVRFESEDYRRYVENALHSRKIFKHLADEVSGGKK